MNAPPFELAGIGILVIGFGLVFLAIPIVAIARLTLWRKER